jgi:hypothetical protein
VCSPPSANKSLSTIGIELIVQKCHFANFTIAIFNYDIFLLLGHSEGGKTSRWKYNEKTQSWDEQEK